jgi:hypothetical protein
LTKLGSHGRIVGQNDKGPGLEVRDLARRCEGKGSRFKEQVLQVAQATRVTRKRMEAARAGDEITDLPSWHRDVSGIGR